MGHLDRLLLNARAAIAELRERAVAREPTDEKGCLEPAALAADCLEMILTDAQQAVTDSDEAEERQRAAGWQRRVTL